LIAALSGDPEQLPSQSVQQIDFHRRRLRATDQVTQPVHQGVGVVVPEEVNFLQGRPQMSEHAILSRERRWRLTPQ
jgi:hypothetical protein